MDENDVLGIGDVEDSVVGPNFNSEDLNIYYEDLYNEDEDEDEDEDEEEE